MDYNGIIERPMHYNGLEGQDLRDLFQSTFNLSYYILRDKTSALKSAIDAMELWQVTSNELKRRPYYEPKGGHRTKVNMNAPQLLQRCVYHATLIFEIEQEESGQANEEDFLVHFTKNLVAFGLKYNSFYVNTAINRILHYYNTPEALLVYDLLAPNRTSKLDIDDIGRMSKRSRKKIMENQKARFGSFIKTRYTTQKEERFETNHNSDTAVQLVKESLRRFVPWETTCAMTTENFDFDFVGSNPDDEHPFEIERIHAVIDPFCHARLMSKLGLSTSDERLEIPKFFISCKYDGSGEERYHPPVLTESEISNGLKELSRRAALRKGVLPRILHIIVDGKELAQLNLDHECSTNIEVIEPELIEISANGVLLASHLFTYDHFSEEQLREYSVILDGEQEIRFSIAIKNNNEDEPETFAINVSYTDTELQCPVPISYMGLPYAESAELMEDWLSIEDVHHVKLCSDSVEEIKPGSSLCNMFVSWIERPRDLLRCYIANLLAETDYYLDQKPYNIVVLGSLHGGTGAGSLEPRLKVQETPHSEESSMLGNNTMVQNRYIIGEPIKQGGMGAVYKANDKKLGYTVALKEFIFSGDALRKAFEREAHLLAKLHHDVLCWADQVLDALEYLHAQEPPVYHLDLKPSNLTLTDRGEIILLDFGLAKSKLTLCQAILAATLDPLMECIPDEASDSLSGGLLVTLINENGKFAICPISVLLCFSDQVLKEYPRSSPKALEFWSKSSSFSPATLTRVRQNLELAVSATANSVVDSFLAATKPEQLHDLATLCPVAIITSMPYGNYLWIIIHCKDFKEVWWLQNEGNIGPKS